MQFHCSSRLFFVKGLSALSFLRITKAFSGDMDHLSCHIFGKSGGFFWEIRISCVLEHVDVNSRRNLMKRLLLCYGTKRNVVEVKKKG